VPEPRRKPVREKRESSARERREKALDAGLKDSMAGSDPVAVVQPSPSTADEKAKRSDTAHEDKERAGE
jgi:hypothetical protein